MSENLFVMPSGEVLPRCAYCLDRPILYRLKDYRFATGDVFNAYFCKICDGIGQAIGHYGSNPEQLIVDRIVDPLMEERMFYHSWAAEQNEEALIRGRPDRYLRYAEIMAWFNDYETSGAWKKDLQIKIREREQAPFNNSRQGDI